MPRVLAGAAFLLAVAVLLAAGFWGFSYDDAFITYRYAHNLAAHGELSYNLGEPVLGTTAPGYAVLLGVLARLVPLGVPAWGTVLGYLSLLACALLVGAVLTARPPPERLALSLLFGLLALTCRWNVEMVGGETLPILALAGLGAWLALARDRPMAAGLVVGLAVLLRLDALLLAGSIGLLAWGRKRRFPLAYTVVVAVLVVPFLVWLQLRFHTVVPITLGAKQAELSVAGTGYARAELRWLERRLPTPAFQALLGLALWESAVLARRAWQSRTDLVERAAPGLALLLWLLLHEIAYHFVGVPFAPWYHVGMLNALLLLATLGALDLGSRLAARLGVGALARESLLGVALALPILLPSLSWVAHQYGTPPDPRWSAYRAAGEIIRRDARGPASVAAVEIGFLGYGSEARVLDLMGLVSPAALAAKQQGTTAELVLAACPDYIVDATTFRDTYLRTVETSPAIAALYGRLADLPDGRAPSVRVVLLKRKSPPGSCAAFSSPG